MSFDIGTIPASVLQSIAEGLATEERAFADEICTRITNKATLNGTVPVLSSASTLARSTNSDVSGLKPGMEATAHEGSMTTTSYSCLAYPGRRIVTDEERNDLGYYGRDEVREAARMARTIANFYVDNDLATILASTTLNNEYDCNSDGDGEWDDQTNGAPLEDLKRARQYDAPGADMLVIGPEALRALLDHPDLYAESSNFAAGQADRDGLAALLRRKIGVTHVHFLEKKYNAAEEGATVSLAYLFDEGVWLGHKRDLLMVDPDNSNINNKLEIVRRAVRRAHDVIYTRYVDIIRPTKTLGVTFSNIIT